MPIPCPAIENTVTMISNKIADSNARNNKLHQRFKITLRYVA
jgi:hypothetical protein